MHHLLYDIRKDAVKKSSKASHRHSREVIEETIISVIKAVCYSKDNKTTDDNSRYFKGMDIQDNALKAFAVEISEFIQPDPKLDRASDIEYAIEYSTAHYWANEPDGFTALLYFLLIRGVILIKEDYSRDKIVKLLLSYIPSGFVSEAVTSKLISK